MVVRSQDGFIIQLRLLILLSILPAHSLQKLFVGLIYPVPAFSLLYQLHSPEVVLVMIIEIDVLRLQLMNFLIGRSSILGD
jgi:hypothetical protein